MYAIFKTGGKQYRASPGECVRIERIEGPIGQTVEFNQVLMVQQGDEARFGRPYLEGARVIGQIVEQHRGPKIRVFRMKRRKGYRKTTGHRQWYTAVRIQDVQV